MIKNTLFVILFMGGSWCFAGNESQGVCSNFCTADKNKCQTLANANAPFYAKQPHQDFFGKQARGIQKNKSFPPLNQEGQSTKNLVGSELQEKCVFEYKQCINSCRSE
jgi:hypothetical protein